jgi:hypothetical protein
MRTKGQDNKQSKSYKAINVTTGLVMQFKGLRAFCTSIWGNNLDGTPKNITRAVDMSNGKRGVRNVKGWHIYKVEKEVEEQQPKSKVDPIGDYLRDKHGK